MKYLKAYYELTIFAGWVLMSGNSDCITLGRSKRYLYSMEEEKWKDLPYSKIVIYKNNTYNIEMGGLSFYDKEILESLKFKLRK